MRGKPRGLAPNPPSWTLSPYLCVMWNISFKLFFLTFLFSQFPFLSTLPIIVWVRFGFRLPGVTQRDLLPITLSKETYYSVNRDLLQCQKRPITVSKETYYLLHCQKRPITVSKETYYSVKRDLLQCQQRPRLHGDTKPKSHSRGVHRKGNG
jgi:hypothetical protein